jgi:hypothetical protein
VKKSVNILYDRKIISELIKNVVYHQKMQEIEYMKAQLIDTAKKNMEYFTSIRNWDKMPIKIICVCVNPICIYIISGLGQNHLKLLDKKT